MTSFETEYYSHLTLYVKLEKKWSKCMTSYYIYSNIQEWANEMGDFKTLIIIALITLKQNFHFTFKVYTIAFTCTSWNSYFLNTTSHRWDPFRCTHSSSLTLAMWLVAPSCWNHVSLLMRGLLAICGNKLLNNSHISLWCYSNRCPIIILTEIRTGDSKWRYYKPNCDFDTV